MRKMFRVGVVSALVALFVGGTAVSAQADVTDEALNYVALGDSYTSGTGTENYYEDNCKLSVEAYPEQLAASHGYNLDFVACHGALISDVANNQVSHLNASTDLVTVSAGGNDTGWGDVIVSCAKPWPWKCWDQIDAGKAFIQNELPGRLDTLYNQIRAAAPNAQVVVVGYPKLFNGESCNVITRISADEQAELNITADLLAETIGSVAASHGFDFADARPGYEGHAVCDDDSYLHGLAWPIWESYHPNSLGHDAYTAAVEQFL